MFRCSIFSGKSRLNCLVNSVLKTSVFCRFESNQHSGFVQNCPAPTFTTWQWFRHQSFRIFDYFFRKNYNRIHAAHSAKTGMGSSRFRASSYKLLHLKTNCEGYWFHFRMENQFLANRKIERVKRREGHHRAYPFFCAARMIALKPAHLFRLIGMSFNDDRLPAAKAEAVSPPAVEKASGQIGLPWKPQPVRQPGTSSWHPERGQWFAVGYCRIYGMLNPWTSSRTDANINSGLQFFHVLPTILPSASPTQRKPRSINWAPKKFNFTGTALIKAATFFPAFSFCSAHKL